ncbi:MAG TPA: MotA/TolQ/ExbB proton channel family protein [Spirochaetia bacterium]|nr:MotA/TolQ/ExbB proton channel family protein [Spirochaetia bacterium]
MLLLIQKGGVVMVLIILLSLVAAIIIIERLIYFRKIRIDEDQMISRLKATLEKGHFDEAMSICESNPAPITNLMKVGIEHRDYSEVVMKDAIVSAANLEIPRLERFLPTLGTIANVATLLGLLGTVIGSIEAFGVLGSAGAVTDPNVLGRGIAVALITTAAGIIVAIPSIGFYNHLVSKVNHIIIRLENRVSEMVLLLIKGR